MKQLAPTNCTDETLAAFRSARKSSCGARRKLVWVIAKRAHLAQPASPVKRKPVPVTTTSMAPLVM